MAYLCGMGERDSAFEDVVDVSEASIAIGGYQEMFTHGLTVIGKIRRFDRWFLVKSIVPAHRHESALRLQLQKEFKILLSLSHPGVVRVYDLVELPDVGLAIIMEYVEGRTLTSMLEEESLSRQQRRDIVVQLADAIDYIHSQGVVHRDLKPDNIMLTYSDSRLKLIDFGFGNAVDSALLKHPAGTRFYAAPEQLEADYEPAPACDIFAFGRILGLLKPGLSLAHAIRRALSDNPDKRPKQATALIASSRRYRRLARMLIVVLLSIPLVGVFVVNHKRDREDNESAIMAVHEESLPKVEPVVAADTSIALPVRNPETVPTVAATRKEAVSPDLRRTVIDGEEQLVKQRNDADRELSALGVTLVARAEEIFADVTLSNRDKKISIQGLIAQYGAEYRRLFNPIIDRMTPEIEAKYSLRWVSWDRLESGKYFRKLESLTGLL